MVWQIKFQISPHGNLYRNKEEMIAEILLHKAFWSENYTDYVC